MSYFVHRCRPSLPCCGFRVSAGCLPHLLSLPKTGDTSASAHLPGKGRHMQGLLRPRGSLPCRNGPGLFTVGGQEVAHPFDGHGLVVSIAFRGGRAFLRSRFVRTQECAAPLASRTRPRSQPCAVAWLCRCCARRPLLPLKACDVQGQRRLWIARAVPGAVEAFASSAMHQCRRDPPDEKGGEGCGASWAAWEQVLRRGARGPRAVPRHVRHAAGGRLARQRAGRGGGSPRCIACAVSMLVYPAAELPPWQSCSLGRAAAGHARSLHGCPWGCVAGAQRGQHGRAALGRAAAGDLRGRAGGRPATWPARTRQCLPCAQCWEQADTVPDRRLLVRARQHSARHGVAANAHRTILCQPARYGPLTACVDMCCGVECCHCCVD